MFSCHWHVRLNNLQLDSKHVSLYNSSQTEAPVSFCTTELIRWCKIIKEKHLMKAQKILSQLKPKCIFLWQGVLIAIHPPNYSQSCVKLNENTLLCICSTFGNFPWWLLVRDLMAVWISCAISDCSRLSLHHHHHHHRVFPRTDQDRLDPALIWEIHIAKAAAVWPRGWQWHHLVMTTTSGVAQTLIIVFEDKCAGSFHFLCLPFHGNDC